MSFDKSIEDRIIFYNNTSKIKNILHIGACLGEEVSFYQMINAESVYWFEPNPKLITQLTENLSGKNFENKVFPYAVSNKKGSYNFNIIENETGTNPGCSSLQELKIHSNPMQKLNQIKDIKLEDSINLWAYVQTFDKNPDHPVIKRLLKKIYKNLKGS